MSPITPTVESRDTGYYGIHYIMNPIPFDSYYGSIKTEQYPFPKFEVQVRTVIQHAWSELQHKVIYKSSDAQPDYKKTSFLQFSQLSAMLSTCDNLLDEAAEPLLPVPSHKIDRNVASEIYSELLQEVQETVQRWESEVLDYSNRREDCEQLEEKFREDIDKLENELKSNYIINLQIAELYLKSANYIKSYNLYKKLEKYSQKDVWLYLRLAETCSSTAKDQEAKESLEALKMIVDEWNNNEQSKDDMILFIGASICSWKIDCLDLAIYFGKKAKEIARGDSPERQLSSELNLLYYEVNQWASELSKNPSRLISQLMERKQDVETIVSKLDAGKIEKFTASKYDTLTYYYYCLAEAAFNVGLIDDSAEHLSKAEKFIGKREEAWSTETHKYEHHHEIWKAHDYMSRRLRERLDNI